MKGKIKSDLKNLTRLITVSGAEQEAVRYIKPRLDLCCDDVEVTGIGSVIARKKGCKKGPSIMFGAHIDEIGYIVKNITHDGFLKFETVGGFEDAISLARKVWVQTDNGNIPGIIGMRPTHLSYGTDGVSQRASYVDIGATSKTDAINKGVQIGASIVLQSDFTEMTDTDLICTKSIDNKISCAILLNLMESIKKEDFAGEIIAAFSTCEETTVSGMIPIWHFTSPDYTIILDTIPAGDVPDVYTEEELPVYLGKGPVMVISSGIAIGGKYSRINPKIRMLIEQARKNLGIDVQEVALGDKSYITEEANAFISGEKGMPVGTLAIPRRYSHTPVELMNMRDAVDMHALLTEIVKLNGTVDMSFA